MLGLKLCTPTPGYKIILFHLSFNILCLKKLSSKRQDCNLLHDGVQGQECVRVQTESREQHGLSVPGHTFTDLPGWIQSQSVLGLQVCTNTPALCGFWSPVQILVFARQAVYPPRLLPRPSFFPGMEINPVLEHSGKHSAIDASSSPVASHHSLIGTHTLSTSCELVPWLCGH